MKMVLMVLVALTSMNAHAGVRDWWRALHDGGPNSYPHRNHTWEQLRAQKMTRINNPLTPQFGKAGVFNACVDEANNKIRSIKDVPYCDDWKVTTVPDGESNTTHDDYSCKHYTDQPVSVDLKYTAKVCVKEHSVGGGELETTWICDQEEVKELTRRTQFDLEVATSQNGVYKTEFFKKYELPSCK